MCLMHYIFRFRRRLVRQPTQQLRVLVFVSSLLYTFVYFLLRNFLDYTL